MPRLPRKLSRDDKFATEWNAMVDYLASLKPVESVGVRTTRTLNGVIREATAKTTAGNGWRWASEKAYDKERGYNANEVVVVTPDNTAVVDGLTDSDTVETVYAKPGLWVCILPTKPEETSPGSGIYTYNAPIWPAPTADDPDAENVYWWPIGFYPMETKGCDDAGNTVYSYVNRSPWSDTADGTEFP